MAQTHDSAMQEKNNEILRLLNQIATDMIRKEDVDRFIAEAVEKATAALEADYKKRMEVMAAKYEARIVRLHSIQGSITLS